ncbi:hypothetical protein ABXN37_11935 [Piscinibacter sakaiensis]|uniref:serine O-acetyltransferase n=1 Tax=Piscinibacter sakaiensis TaxID=1547922 RepID=UPI00372C96F5
MSPPIDFARTRALIASDFRRLLQALGNPPSKLKRVFWFLLPSYQSLFWYRLYHWLHLRNFRTLAWFMYLVNFYVTRVEIPPTTVIGEACLIGHPNGVVLCGRVGDRFTLYGEGGIGGGMGDGDVGGGPGLPCVGDDVVFAIRAIALGPIRIGDGAKLGPGAIVTTDVPAGAPRRGR